MTLVLLNTNKDSVGIYLAGRGLPDTLQKYVTSQKENCTNKGKVNTSNIILPPQSITTLYAGFKK
jgi:hypothetical protein